MTKIEPRAPNLRNQFKNLKIIILIISFLYVVPHVLLYTYQAFKMRISGFRVDYNVCLSRAPFVALNAKEG